MGQTQQQPATGPVILDRLIQLEQTVGELIKEFRGYAATSRAERRALRAFIEDDVRELLLLVSEQQRGYRAELRDLQSALELNKLSDLPPARTQRQQRQRKAS